jgi:hypothetical protein
MRPILFCVAAAVLFAGAGRQAEAGAVKGAIKRVNTVQGFHVMTYKVTFEPGHLAVVTVQGDGDTALAVVILDAQGRRVAAGRKVGEVSRVRWTPASNGPYRIRIHNRGGVPNRFLLQTN